MIMTIPVFAACSITGGACSTGYNSNFDSPPLQEKYAPNSLQEITKPNAFQPKYIKPYYNELINTSSSSNETSDYNSNCQFGVCLPETEPGGNVLE